MALSRSRMCITLLLWCGSKHGGGTSHSKTADRRIIRLHILVDLNLPKTSCVRALPGAQQSLPGASVQELVVYLLSPPI